MGWQGISSQVSQKVQELSSKKKTNVVKAKRENVEKFTTQSELLKLLKRQL